MNFIGMVLFFLVGIIQFFAILNGLESWWGLHWIIAGPVAFIVAYIPILGAVVGMVGAVDVWRWEWWQAALLFFGGLLLPLIMGGGSIILSKVRKP
ncbi:hypothetical protein [Kosakonia radicincitans]|uniref:hypothetical protein n=1 Tax=Kosakonia radicincitans TaxID=283686 RepID=UPI001D073C0B|nr:hypothetical protein [Kosakonia radicincitans]